MSSQTISKEKPYLDTLSSGSIYNYQKFELHKKLSKKPIIIPDLSHVSVEQFGNGKNVLQNRYANYDGSVTNKLRNLIARVPKALQSDYRRASREASEDRYYSKTRYKQKTSPSIEALTPSEASQLERDYEKEEHDNQRYSDEEEGY